MSSNSLLYRYIFHGTRLSVDPAYQSYLTSIGLDDLSAWSDFDQGEALSVGKTVCLRVKPTTQADTVYFKRYLYKKNIWEFFLRRSKAANEFINYQRLKKLGIPTLETVALYEQRSFGRLKFACIITKELPNTMQLDDFYKGVLLNMPKQQAHRVFSSLIEQLFQQIRTAHNAGFFHLDLKWRNILIQQHGDSYQPIWIDCPRGIQRRYFNERLKVADLSGLSRKALSFFSPQQLYRMLRQYLGQGSSKAEARKLFFDIAKHLGRRLPQEQKS